MTDRFPQLLTATTGVAGAVDDYVVSTITLPRADSGRGSKRMVYEILKVYYYIGVEDPSDGTSIHAAYLATTTPRASADTCTGATLVADFQVPTVFAPVLFNRNVNTSGGTTTTLPMVVDLTDDAGNGILVATERITLVGGSAGNTAAASYTAKILYRIVDVPALEFVGIVQSQISGT